MTETESTTLFEFVDADVDGGAGDGTDDVPAPAENAADIARLADVVGEVTDQVAAIADELAEQDTTDSIDTEPAASKRMFH